MARYKIETSDRAEHLQAIHGIDFYLVLWNLDQHLRSQIKYNPDGLGGHELDALEKVREQIYDLMSQYDISFDMFE